MVNFHLEMKKCVFVPVLKGNRQSLLSYLLLLSLDGSTA